MEMNGGFLVTKIKQLGDRIFEKILSEKNIDETILMFALFKCGKTDKGRN